MKKLSFIFLFGLVSGLSVSASHSNKVEIRFTYCNNSGSNNNSQSGSSDMTQKSSSNSTGFSCAIGEEKINPEYLQNFIATLQSGLNEVPSYVEIYGMEILDQIDANTGCSMLETAQAAKNYLASRSIMQRKENERKRILQIAYGV